MTHPTRTALNAAIADAKRGHRITEYEGVASRLALAASQYAAHVDEVRAQVADFPEHPDVVDRISHFAQRILKGGAETADGSFDLDYAHDELAKAIDDYLGKEATTGLAPPKTLEQMQAEVTSWCERKGWKGEGSAPVTFGDVIALLHSEASEALEAYRDWGLNDATAAHSPSSHIVICAWRRWVEDPLVSHSRTSPAPRCDCEFGEGKKPEGVGSEFADILIRLLDDCDRYGIDLRFEFERKMAYNEKRPYQHGGRIL